MYSFPLYAISLMEDRNKLILHKLQPRPKATFVLFRSAQVALQGRRWGTGPFGIAICSSLPVGFKAQMVEIQLQNIFHTKYKS